MIVAVGGVILIVMGILIVTGEFKQLNIQAQSWSSTSASNTERLHLPLLDGVNADAA